MNSDGFNAAADGAAQSLEDIRSKLYALKMKKKENTPQSIIKELNSFMKAIVSQLDTKLRASEKKHETEMKALRERYRSAVRLNRDLGKQNRELHARVAALVALNEEIDAQTTAVADKASSLLGGLSVQHELLESFFTQRDASPSPSPTESSYGTFPPFSEEGETSRSISLFDTSSDLP
eukprot:gnl/Chilomastix_cuspidata/5958.p1 GENE.gnl/Chilomastix_cuspidata/5958~~gnl/Chilomastix_cuspidata/5958.p1  ORF type:complete len:179 (-),score=49.93 gnl/Chilomastix_cuspidata/5958:30-566(-)